MEGTMDIEKYRDYADDCFRDTPPPCSSKCPFGLDVRKFIEKMQNGKYKSAHRIYRSAVMFPGIVSTLCDAPCEHACVRASADRAVRLKKLEAFCHQETGGKPQRYTLPRKEQRITVIGAGLSGLACALRMASRGYHVTVFEKGTSIGGSALQKMDPAMCLSDLENEFSPYNCTFITEKDVTSLDEVLPDADAVYVATGEGGEDFDLLRDNVQPETLGTSIPGVFLGGQRRTGGSLMEAMTDGINAADSIEVYFKLGNTDYTFKHTGSVPPDGRYYDLQYDFSEPSSSDGDEFDPAKEAGRCLRCNCSKCYDVCPLMQTDGRYPKKMCTDIVTTLKPNATRRPGVRMIASCTFCGKCKEVCPEHIDMGACLKSARKDLFADGHFALALHDYWMQDLDFCLSGDSYLVWSLKQEKKSDVVFFPGCQLSASSPGLVRHAYEYLTGTADNPALYLGCCGIPAEWAGDTGRRQEVTDRICAEWKRLGKPLFVLACTACQVNLRQYCPEIQTISLYRFMDMHPEHLPLPAVKLSKKIQLFDPCGSADDPKTRQSVRRLAHRYGCQSDDSPEVCGCCGFGGHIYPANPKLFDSLAQAQTDLTDSEIITYCANCRDIFAAQGRECRHLLDLIFGSDDSKRQPPTLDERRDNRRLLKQHITGGDFVKQQSYLKIDICEQLQKKLDRLLIRGEEVIKTIEAGEESGRKLYDRGKNLYYVHHRFKNITVWVVYAMADDTISVRDVYSHRVDIREG